jgi:hypothetical protein
VALNFPGWTKQKLEAALESALAEQSEGATLSDTGAGDTSSRFQVQLSIQTRIDMISQDPVSRWPEEFAAADYIHPTSGRYVQ